MIQIEEKRGARFLIQNFSRSFTHRVTFNSQWESNLLLCFQHVPAVLGESTARDIPIHRHPAPPHGEEEVTMLRAERPMTVAAGGRSFPRIAVRISKIQRTVESGSSYAGTSRGLHAVQGQALTPYIALRLDRQGAGEHAVHAGTEYHRPAHKPANLLPLQATSFTSSNQHQHSRFRG